MKNAIIMLLETFVLHGRCINKELLIMDSAIGTCCRFIPLSVDTINIRKILNCKGKNIMMSSGFINWGLGVGNIMRPLIIG